MLLSVKGVRDIAKLAGLERKGEKVNIFPIVSFNLDSFFLLRRTTRGGCQAVRNNGKVPVKQTSLTPFMLFSIQIILVGDGGKKKSKFLL